jgi:hypothetical protein
MTTTYPLVVPLGTSLRPDVPPLDAITRAFATFWNAPIPAASLQPALPQPGAAAALLPSNELTAALAQALSGRGGVLPTAAHPHLPASTPAAAAAAAFSRAAGGANFAPPVNPAPMPFATAAAMASSSPALSASLT